DPMALAAGGRMSVLDGAGLFVLAGIFAERRRSTVRTGSSEARPIAAAAYCSDSAAIACGRSCDRIPRISGVCTGVRCATSALGPKPVYRNERHPVRQDRELAHTGRIPH